MPLGVENERSEDENCEEENEEEPEGRYDALDLDNKKYIIKIFVLHYQQADHNYLQQNLFTMI